MFVLFSFIIKEDRNVFKANGNFALIRTEVVVLMELTCWEKLAKFTSGY